MKSGHAFDAIDLVNEVHEMDTKNMIEAIEQTQNM